MPSPHYSKQKGREAENGVVAYLQSNGYGQAERRRQAGVYDRGDIAGIPGTVVEVKDEKKTDLAGWVRELEAEMRNAHAHRGAVVRKRRGKPYKPADPDSIGNVGDWYAVLPFSMLVELWHQADRQGGQS